MFDAQTIQKFGSGADTVVYSPWFPRGGDYGVFTMEVVAIGGSNSPTLAVGLVQKNSDETGDGDPVPTGTVNFERTSAGRTSVDFTAGMGAGAFAGFEQLVRYEFTLSGGASNETSYVTFRMLAPVWYDKV